VKPASLTNGVTPVVAEGEFQNQVGRVLAGISGGAPSKPTLILSLQSALRLTALRDLESLGIRVIVSPAAEDRLIAIDADRAGAGDEGAEVRTGTPDIEMVDSTTNPPTASTVLVSTWQRNLQVVRVEHWVNWIKAADAVAYLTLA
jgi:hypothetical protein